jgi:cytochrome c-type biogenesis protein CcmE
MGTYGYDGVLHANVLQAKCASKYAPAGPNQPSTKPAAPASPKSNAAAPAAGQAKPAA